MPHPVLTRVFALLALPCCTATAADLPQQADLSVSGVLLDDSASAKLPLGQAPRLDDPDSDRPKAYFCNQDNSERLTLVYYEGDTANIVSEMQVEHVDTPYVDCEKPPQPIAQFVSGKGIHLGMSMREAVERLGSNFTQHLQTNETVISYRIDRSASGFLQQHNAPAYYGQYHFLQGRLVKFGFGFEFP